MCCEHMAHYGSSLLCTETGKFAFVSEEKTSQSATVQRNDSVPVLSCSARVVHRSGNGGYRLAHQNKVNSGGGILCSLEIKSVLGMSRKMPARKCLKGLPVHLMVDLLVLVLLNCFTARAIEVTPHFQSNSSKSSAESHLRFTEAPDSSSEIRVDASSTPQLFTSLGRSRRHSSLSNPSVYLELLIDELPAIGKSSIVSIPSFRAPPLFLS